MITAVLSWILFLQTISQSSFKSDSAASDYTSCSPFRLLVIWHTSKGEDDAFTQQKRLIITLINIIPQGTEVQVTALNTRLNHILHFETNISIDWIYNISMYSPENLENHTIQGSLINNLVLNFSEQNIKKEVADKILLVVSENTEIEKRSVEMIRNVKQLVVFTGRNLPPSLWNSLATDKHHLVILNTTFENPWAIIPGAANKVLDSFCQDSRFSCDVDKFLAGDRCISCSYICSADSKTPPDICSELCPDLHMHPECSPSVSIKEKNTNYKRFTPKSTTIETNKKDTGENTKPTTVWIFILCALSSLLLPMLIAILISKPRNLTQKTKSDSTPSTLIVNESQTCKENPLSNNSYTHRRMSI